MLSRIAEDVKIIYYLKFQDGASVTTADVTRIFHGTIIVFLADTLGAHQVGGFKVGVGLSL